MTLGHSSSTNFRRLFYSRPRPVNSTCSVRVLPRQQDSTCDPPISFLPDPFRLSSPFSSCFGISKEVLTSPNTATSTHRPARHTSCDPIDTVTNTGPSV